LSEIKNITIAECMLCAARCRGVLPSSSNKLTSDLFSIKI